MTIGKFIKVKLTEREMNQATLAEKAGFKNQSNIAMLLKSNNMQITKLFAMLNALDCELVIRDKVTGSEQVISQE